MAEKSYLNPDQTASPTNQTMAPLYYTDLQMAQMLSNRPPEQLSNIAGPVNLQQLFPQLYAQQVNQQDQAGVPPPAPQNYRRGGLASRFELPNFQHLKRGGPVNMKIPGMTVEADPGKITAALFADKGLLARYGAEAPSPLPQRKPTPPAQFTEERDDEDYVPGHAKGGLIGPTEGQKHAGNYKKAHGHVHGLPIAIENEAGSVRSGKGADGKPWSVRMPHHYGYFNRTKGKDGDQVDVHVGPRIDSHNVHIIDQVDPKTKKFDEHKVMMGFEHPHEAVHAYHSSFSDGKGHLRMGGMVSMHVDDFKKWLKSKSKTQRRAAPGERANVPNVGGILQHFAAGGLAEGVQPLTIAGDGRQIVDGSKTDTGGPPLDTKGGVDWTKLQSSISSSPNSLSSDLRPPLSVANPTIGDASVPGPPHLIRFAKGGSVKDGWDKVKNAASAAAKDTGHAVIDPFIKMGDVAMHPSHIIGNSTGETLGNVANQLMPFVPVPAMAEAKLGARAAKGAVVPKVLYHGGNFDPAKPGPTYFTPNKEMANSYVDMTNDRFGPGTGKLSTHTVQLNNPADEATVAHHARQVGINPEETVPASMLDRQIHGDEPVDQLVARLKDAGHDGAILDDTGYGKQIQDKAHIVFDPSHSVQSAAPEAVDMGRRGLLKSMAAGAAALPLLKGMTAKKVLMGGADAATLTAERAALTAARGLPLTEDEFFHHFKVIEPDHKYFISPAEYTTEDLVGAANGGHNYIRNLTDESDDAETVQHPPVPHAPIGEPLSDLERDHLWTKLEEVAHKHGDITAAEHYDMMDAAATHGHDYLRDIIAQEDGNLPDLTKWPGTPKEAHGGLIQKFAVGGPVMPAIKRYPSYLPGNNYVPPLPHYRDALGNSEMSATRNDLQNMVR